MHVFCKHPNSKKVKSKSEQIDKKILSLHFANLRDGLISSSSDDFHFPFISTTQAIQSKSYSSVHLVPVQFILDPVCQSQISRKVSFSSRNVRPPITTFALCNGQAINQEIGEYISLSNGFLYQGIISWETNGIGET